MTQNLDATYPTIARWVQEYGWMEIGQDDMSRSFIRALDDGGMVWEGRRSYPTLDGVRLSKGGRPVDDITTR